MKQMIISKKSNKVQNKIKKNQKKIKLKKLEKDKIKKIRKR